MGVCSQPGGTCCVNTLGNNFVCAPGNFCCGNACASHESQCCKDPNTGYEFPLLKSTPCPTALLQTDSNAWSKMKMSNLQPNFSPVAQIVSKSCGRRRMLRQWVHVWALLRKLQRLQVRLRTRQRVLCDSIHWLPIPCDC